MKRTMQLHPAFKPFIAAAVGGWLAMSVATASAQMTPQTADMSVTGTIVPAACSASFTGGGVVDFGTIKLVDLPNDYSLLGTKDVDLNVTCTSSKSVRFNVEDLQATSKVSDAAFRARLGVGNDASFYGLGTGVVGGQSVNLGGFTIQVKPSYVGGGGAAVGHSVTGTGTWFEPADYVVPGGPFYTVVNRGTPIAGLTFRYLLTVKAALNKASELQVAQDTRLNGQAVFAISYQ